MHSICYTGSWAERKSGHGNCAAKDASKLKGGMGKLKLVVAEAGSYSPPPSMLSTLLMMLGAVKDQNTESSISFGVASGFAR